MTSVYTQVCPVVFGAGSLSVLGEKAKELGASRVICICDGGVRQAGIADRILQLLRREGLDADLFDQIVGEPTDELAEKAGQAARDFGADLIVGVGGGSSLDAAKCVAVLSCNPPPLSQYLLSNGGTHRRDTPLILLPTTAGTGSEVSNMAVVMDHRTHVKDAVMHPADLAIVDPELTLSVPPVVTAATGMDAMAHAVESLTNNLSNPKADLLALEAVRLIGDNLENAVEQGSDLAARCALSLASNLAGMAFNDSSVHFGHAVAHELGRRFGIPHGAACALTLPQVILFSAEILPHQVLRIAQALRLNLSTDITCNEIGQAVAQRLLGLLRKMGIRSLEELRIGREEAMDCAGDAIANNWFVSCAPGCITEGLLRQQIGMMYDGYK